MRKRAGIGAIKQRQLDREKFNEKGNELAETQLKQLSGQLEQFRTNLETFATEHKQEIRWAKKIILQSNVFFFSILFPRRDPEFRRRFQEMCAQIGVDPLASGKGFWSNVLDIGDFYYELGKTFHFNPS